MQKKTINGEKREDTERRAGVHCILEILLEGAGTLTVCPPGSMKVKVSECEHWRLRPVHAAPLLDTSPSSAACGSETSPRFVGHHELRLGRQER
ncbi:hypothetical protein F7725_024057 [Dissostichus mawsoni]|uniref:Uncharacterized protein n=1 Tax=Dissostichus mawsoni TaxID=36200 RepID=A0A7J5XYA0_DISMA|nr:hypothetical protein F7725_024057 [Dissostichus mawsoni]